MPKLGADVFGLVQSMGAAALLAALLLAVCVAAEMASPLSKVRGRFPGALYLVLLPAMTILLSWPLSQVWQSLGIRPLFSIAGPLMPLLFVLIFDFLRYWEHRFEHWKWWRVHSIHHSQTDLHAANSYSHPLIAVPEFFIVVIPLSLIDTGGPVYAAAAFVAFQNLVIHSPLRVHLGPLRHVMVDSRFHRIHHSLDPRHFGKNFGIVFTFWDRLFRTAYFPKPDEWPDVGVSGTEPPSSVRDYLLRPLAR